MRHLALTTAIIAAAAAQPLVAQNRIDGQSPDAPELAAYGPLPVGVRTFEFVNKDQVDILAIDPAGPKPDVLPLYDRPLSVEVWYPAAEGATGETSFNTFLRDGKTEVTLTGSAFRDAEKAAGAEPFPLLILSHGYPGNRFLMSHLAENIASKGYVVASIDHTESTYENQKAFGSTLVNRPLDQLFVLDQMAKASQDATSPLHGLVNADNSAILGYSMGGYGAIIAAGGGVTGSSVQIPWGAPHGTLGIHQAGSPTHEALPDPRVKTAIAIGPWGRQWGFWDEEGLAGIDIPMMFIGGSKDGVSQYEAGIRKIWEETSSVDRALLTFKDGGHNTVAPIPAPKEAAAAGVTGHYSDPVWDSVFMNNVGQHFVTAWLDFYLKGDAAKWDYLNLVEKGDEGVFSLNPDGTFASDHSYWKGFQDGTAAGLSFEVLAPAVIPLPASAWLLGFAVAGLGALRRRHAV